MAARGQQRRSLDATAIETMRCCWVRAFPGFVLDLLPFVLSRVCERITTVHAKRSVNASRRRRRLQAKTARAMDRRTSAHSWPREDRARGPGGPRRSRRSLGWPWDDFEETIDPIVAAEPVASEHFTVAAGQVRGQYQVLRMGQVTLELTMALGE